MTGTQKCILLVEDDPAVRQLLESALRKQGYRVIVAEDGDKGLALVRQQACVVDLVLTDVLLPGLKGPELVAEMAKDCPDVKVIYITGYSDITISNPIQCCPDQILYKPFPIQKLLNAIERCLS